jgi:hypothetical protein
VRRNWLVAALVLGLVAIAIAVIAMRLSDDDSSEATAWAGSVCTSLSEWRGEIEALADVDAGDLNAEALRGKLEDAQTATDDLVSDLQALGRPELEAGDEAEAALDDAADGLRESYEDLKDAASAALDAGSPMAFLEALAALGPRFQALIDDVQDAFTSLRTAAGDASDELEQAFDDADSCQELRDEG